MMMKKYSSCVEISQAIEQTFTASCEQKNFFSALVPFITLQAENKEILLSGIYTEDALRELWKIERRLKAACACAKQHKPNDASWYETTIKLMVYSHIIEADLPYIVLLNLLRIQKGWPTCTQFLCRDKDDNIKPNKKNEPIIIEAPIKKAEQIEQTANNQDCNVGTLLKEIIDPKLRNAFAHSQYCMTPDDDLIVMSPFCGGQTTSLKKACKKLTLYTKDEIDAIYDAATQFLNAFRLCYLKHIERFKDGQKYFHEACNREIIWTGQDWI